MEATHLNYLPVTGFYTVDSSKFQSGDLMTVGVERIQGGLNYLTL